MGGVEERWGALRGVEGRWGALRDLEETRVEVVNMYTGLYSSSSGFKDANQQMFTLTLTTTKTFHNLYLILVFRDCYI